jgi:hypothetical protein
MRRHPLQAKGGFVTFTRRAFPCNEASIFPVNRSGVIFGGIMLDKLGGYRGGMLTTVRVCCLAMCWGWRLDKAAGAFEESCVCRCRKLQPKQSMRRHHCKLVHAELRTCFFAYCTPVLLGFMDRCDVGFRAL